MSKKNARKIKERELREKRVRDTRNSDKTLDTFSSMVNSSLQISDTLFRPSDFILRDSGSLFD